MALAGIRRLFGRRGEQTAEKASTPSAPREGVSARSLDAEVARLRAETGRADDETVQFGPGVAPAPQPLDESGQPRAYHYRTGWNLPSLPGEGRPLDLGTLRLLADSYDILRKAIEVRKDELCAMQLDVIAREPDRRRAREVVSKQQDKIAEIRAFFAFPDRRHSLQAWLRRLLEDYFVVDAVTIWKWRTLGGQLHGLRLLDGATIKPLLTAQGDTPSPPEPAYQQYLYGVARDDFTADELIYAPKNRRNTTPYGFSPIEQFLTHINLALRFQRFTTDYFTDGTLPEGVAMAPETWTAAQIQEFNEYWERLLAGDSRALRKLHFVPFGFKFEQLKPWSFDATFARWLVEVTCAALDVTPQELGFEPVHSGLGGKGYAEEQSTILQRKSLQPLIRWLCDEVFNPLIWEEFGAPDLQATFKRTSDSEEQLQAMQARDVAIRNGTLSIDQAVEEDGGEPPGIGRLFVVGNTVLFERDLIAGTSPRTHLRRVPAPPRGRGTAADGREAAQMRRGGSWQAGGGGDEAARAFGAADGDKPHRRGDGPGGGDADGGGAGPGDG